MGFAEYDRFDGLGLAELIARGEVTPEELLEEAIDRAERVGATGVLAKPFDLEDLRLAAALLLGNVPRFG